MSMELTLPGFHANETGLSVAGELTQEQWEEAGYVLGAMDRRLAWYVGDWLLAGESAGYLPRGKLEEACKRFGIAYDTAKKAAYVSRAYLDKRCRRPHLSFSHHQAVANRPDADELLDWAEETGASRQDLRQQVKRISLPQFNSPGDLPDGKYNLILADPPWRYDFSRSDSRKIENHYPTMELEEICALDVPAADDCVLFLWATAPKLTEAIQVMLEWGFEYKTNMVWAKTTIGMGYYARSKHEQLLIAAKGSPGVPEESVRPVSIIEAPRGEHSRKPEQFYELIESMYPNHNKLELFARNAREGWDAWGNHDLQRFSAMPGGLEVSP